ATGEWVRRALTALDAVTGGQGGLAAAGTGDDAVRASLVQALGDRPSAVGDSLLHFATAAASVREYLSTSTWRLLGPLEAARHALPVDAAKAEMFVVVEELDKVMTELAAFAGFTMESTVRGPGWRFLDIGRRIERALLLIGLLEATLLDRPDPLVVQPLYELVLVAGESLVAYRRRYRSDLELDALCELLLADDANPRSLAFQLDRLGDDLATLPERRERRDQQALLRVAAEALIGFTASSEQELRKVLLATRGPLLELDASVVAAWFAHTHTGRAVGGS
ncbi:MAG TPA: alpha-E domain-containing protein, partial [Acidimicrobiales bacterium]